MDSGVKLLLERADNELLAAKALKRIIEEYSLNWIILGKLFYFQGTQED